MNIAVIIGSLTKDVDIRYGAQSQTAVARFSVAVDRGKDKDGNDKGTDFPNVVCFGKTAELCDKYLAKGRMVGVEGRIQTGSYEGTDGKKVYTTEIVANRVTFLDNSKGATPEKDETPEGFSKLEDDIPF